MRDELIQFFEDRVDAIKKGDDLCEIIYDKLLEMLENDNYEHLDKVLSVHRLLSNENNTAAAGVLGIFKPVPGGQSLFLEVARPADKDEEIKKVFKNASAEDLQALERVMGHLAVLSKKDEAVVIKEDALHE